MKTTTTTTEMNTTITWIHYCAGKEGKIIPEIKKKSKRNMKEAKDGAEGIERQTFHLFLSAGGQLTDSKRVCPSVVCSIRVFLRLAEARQDSLRSSEPIWPPWGRTWSYERTYGWMEITLPTGHRLPTAEKREIRPMGPTIHHLAWWNDCMMTWLLKLLQSLICWTGPIKPTMRPHVWWNNYMIVWFMSCSATDQHAEERLIFSDFHESMTDGLTDQRTDRPSVSLSWHIFGRKYRFSLFLMIAWATWSTLWMRWRI